MSEPSGGEEVDEVALAGLKARIQALIEEARRASLEDHTISAAFSEAAKALLDIASDNASGTAPVTASRLTWARAGDRYPVAGVPDDFLALDESGAEVGLVKLVALGPDEGRWLWSMLLTHPGPAFQQPANGTCELPTS